MHQIFQIKEALLSYPNNRIFISRLDISKNSSSCWKLLIIVKHEHNKTDENFRFIKKYDIDKQIVANQIAYISRMFMRKYYYYYH